MPYLSIWQLFMTLSGTVALSASCWGFCRISTWSEWSIFNLLPSLENKLQPRLKLSHTKRVTKAFYLNNRDAKHKLKVYNNDRLLPFCSILTYVGIKLDRSLTLRHHLVALNKKTNFARHTVAATCKLRMECWCQTLRTVVLSLVYSRAEYCAPVWCRGAHTRFIDSVLRPTPTDHLPIL